MELPESYATSQSAVAEAYPVFDFMSQRRRGILKQCYRVVCTALMVFLLIIALVLVALYAYAAASPYHVAFHSKEHFASGVRDFVTRSGLRLTLSANALPRGVAHIAVVVPAGSLHETRGANGAAAVTQEAISVRRCHVLSIAVVRARL